MRLRLLQMVLGLDRLDGAFSRDVVRRAASLQPSPTLSPPSPTTPQSSPPPAPQHAPACPSTPQHARTHPTHPSTHTAHLPHTTPRPRAPSVGPRRRLPCGGYRRRHVGPGRAAACTRRAEGRQRRRCALPCGLIHHTPHTHHTAITHSPAPTSALALIYPRLSPSPPHLPSPSPSPFARRPSFALNCPPTPVHPQQARSATRSTTRPHALRPRLPSSPARPPRGASAPRATLSARRSGLRVSAASRADGVAPSALSYWVHISLYCTW